MFFKFTTAGESHGKALAAIVEGVPAGLEIDIAAIDHELWRRQQGYGRGARMKIEKDTIEIVSGVRHGKTLGSPIGLMIQNRDFKNWQDVMRTGSPTEGTGIDRKENRTVTRPRPGHADLAGGQKFAARDLRDILERSSARETAARVACGAIAKQLLAFFGTEIKSHVIKIGHVQAVPLWRDWKEIAGIPDDALLNCADDTAQSEMIKLIDETKKAGDTLGGIFEVVARGVPVGLGAHTSWNEKLDGHIAQAIMSIHAVKAVEIGTAVANAAKLGSEVHDEISHDGLAFTRSSNRAGGLEGGITNGEELRVRGYMKPLSTLRRPLQSVDIDTKEASEAAFERSDITAVPAAGIVGEAMVAIVLANAMRAKFGGDSVQEMERNFESYLEAIRNY